MILRPRIEDNYDPESPWIVEYANTSSWMYDYAEMRKFLKGNQTVTFRGRKIGFDNETDAVLFYLTFK